ncbi:MAG: helix-turn-helix domain-containing protein [Acidobacteriota bacterium]
MHNTVTSTTLYIKNMVCDRCIRVVREELETLGYDVRRAELGEAEIAGAPSAGDLESIGRQLRRSGFELIEDKNAKLIEAVKRAIIRLVHKTDGPMPSKYSDYIASEVGRDYHSLSVLFSSVENITIEHFLIRQKIERVKELMKYGELTLSEIAYRMNYSSVQHLSHQFKSVTGLTPSQFKELSAMHLPQASRLPLDKVK